jgi:hypothetical protein
MRRILWIAAVFNMCGAFLFAFPESPLGQLVGLPVPVPGIYSAILAFLVALFGATYGWLATQPTIDRPMVAFFAVGKAGVFALVGAFWVAGAVPGPAVLVASGDLIFAVLFARWLRARKSD